MCRPLRAHPVAFPVHNSFFDGFFVCGNSALTIRVGAGTSEITGAVILHNLIPQTALALEGFLLVFYRSTFVSQDFSSPPTCLELPRLA